MAVLESINLGIVGLRRGAFAGLRLDGLRLHALCDADPARLDKAVAQHPGVERWTDFNEMIERSKLDAVLIATPMPLHAPQSIAALNRGLHVMSEVPGGVSIEECRDLVLACRSARGLYMMMENMNYFRHVQIVTEMVKRGMFGQTYYAQGEYLHELKSLIVKTPWRRKWAVGVNGITYGTHSLGPALAWMPGDRVESVSCAGSGHRHADHEGRAYEIESTCVMLAKTTRGSLIKIRQDFLSDRPSCHKFVLQGTDGAFETSGIDGATSKVWLRGRSGGKMEWRTLDEMADEFLPDLWRRHGPTAAGAGHGGSDFIQLADFVDAIRQNKPSPIGIDAAMDMTLPGLVSQRSIACGGIWLSVPDSRLW
ncbi:MAG: Gfo/Idh/MocA family oxidoreductase [Planctomycetes bacterium]|nr:Gfo/Idh/MocA family oxidoreductase [Planctomycetota bacterium]